MHITQQLLCHLQHDAEEGVKTGNHEMRLVGEWAEGQVCGWVGVCVGGCVGVWVSR